MSTINTADYSSTDNAPTSQPGSPSYIDDRVGLETAKDSDETKEQGPWLKDVLAHIYANPQANSKPEDPDDERTGRSSSIKKLYEGPERCGCCINWVEDYPDNTKDCIENTLESKEHALLVRVKRNHAGRNPTTIDSIVVQSPLLKTILQRILDKYPGLSPQLDYLVFEAPFECFFHRWSLLEAALKAEENEETHKHLSLLHAVLAEELKDTLSGHRDLTSHGVIRFRDLWMIFMPDDNIYMSLNRRQSEEVGRLSRAYYGRDGEGNVFILNYRQVSWDGYQIGYCDDTFSIRSFDGTCPIVDLKAYPFQYHESRSELRQKLIARGRRFKSLAEVKLMAYKGLAVEQSRGFFGRTSRHSYMENGRIMLDAKLYHEQSPDETAWTYSFDKNSSKDSDGVSHASHCTSSNCSQIISKSGTDADNVQGNTSKKSLDDLAEDESKDDKLHPVLSEEQLLICSPLVKGYCLKSKKWAEFYVDDVREIEWNDRALSSLVLPADYRKLLLAFVESQVKHEADFDDVITGKGSGMIMLLAGPPGTGKTLTAESVAEHLRVPLYSMSAEELGTTASSVEAKLDEIFNLTVEWKAVLLIDEADVFLESRTIRDLERNKLVSVFLRTLEYYKGFLFLTTNRPSAIDEAFESRIHLTIRYPQLDVTARKSVWANFVDVEHDGNALTDKDLTALAEEEINGRQIKNVVKTAQLLAYTNKEALAEEHIRTVLRVMKENRLTFRQNDGFQ